MHQDTVIEFLKNPDNHDLVVTDVDVIETHISFVFITNNRVYKLKRTVHYPYLDFSCLENVNIIAIQRYLSTGVQHLIFILVLPLLSVMALVNFTSPMTWNVQI